jgi:hypothetical protein
MTGVTSTSSFRIDPISPILSVAPRPRLPRNDAGCPPFGGYAERGLRTTLRPGAEPSGLCARALEVPLWASEWPIWWSTRCRPPA